MQPKVELSQIRRLTEIVDDSVLFLKQNWKPLLKAYFTICGIFWVAGLVISVLNQTRTVQLQNEFESGYSITYFLSVFLVYINFIFIALTALSFIALYHEKGNQAPMVNEVWGYFKYYFLRVFGSSVLLAIFLSVGIVMCLLPGIYLFPVFLLVITVMVLENASFRYSFSRGFQLIKQNWWYLCGVLIVASIIVIAAMILFAILVAMIVTLLLVLTKLNHQDTELMALVLTLHALQVLYLLPVIAVALAYFSFNEQKDDFSLLQRIEMIGKNKQDDAQLPSEEY